MNIRLAYGDTQLELIVPPNAELIQFAPQTADRPLRFEEFKDQFRQSGGDAAISTATPLFIVNDGHRATPTAVVLTWLDQIDPSLLDRAEFLIATGTHDRPTKSHLAEIFGRHLSRIGNRIKVHDCRDYDAMENVGEDSFGGDVWINRTYLDAESVVAINSVEPHYFAGFSGGRKSLFPGLTDFSTVERNHNLANSLECAPLRLTGNPMAEHLEELLGMVELDKLFSIQIIFDSAQNLCSAFMGDLQESFRSAAVATEKMFAFEVRQPFDVIVCEILPPLDNSLYQAQKGVENSRAAVKKNGAIVVISKCTDGVGSRHFFELAKQWDGATNQPKDGRTRFGSHKLSRINALSKHAIVGIHCDVDDASVRQVFYTPIHDINEFIGRRAKETDKFRLAVVKDAGNVVLKATF